jgi:hypothetical protein
VHSLQRSFRRAGALVVSAALLLPALALRAQPPVWHGKAQASASLFFGATEQQLVATQGELSRADSAVEVSLSAELRYGESTDGDGVRSVHARSWLTNLAVDRHPYATVSPFLFGTLESSLEHRLARRAAGGVGAKWTLRRTARGSVSLSGALLGERARPMWSADRPVTEAASVARWSLRVKFDRKDDDRLSYSHVTFYQPVVDDPSRYLVISTSQAAYALTAAVAATLSFSERFDSEARSRGARSNHDGHLLVGVALSR